MSEAQRTSTDRSREVQARRVQVLGFVCLLAALTLWFLGFIVPPRLALSARAMATERFQLVSDARESFIPGYQFHLPNRRLEGDGAFTTLELDIANEATSTLGLKFQSATNQVAFQSIGIKGLFLRTDWDAARIVNEFTIAGGHREGIRGGDAEYRSGQNAILSAPPAFVQELRGLQQREAAIVAALFLFGLAALSFPFWRKLAVPPQRIVGSLESGLTWLVRNRAALVMLALLLLGSARLLFLVLQEPMVGIPNNGDFFRLQACLGWQSNAPTDAEGIEVVTNVPPLYRVGLPVVKEVCYLSSQLLWLAPAPLTVGLFGPRAANGGLLDLRAVGTLSALALITTGSVLTWMFARVSSTAGLLSAAVFAFMLADPMYGLFFNTLYSEFAGLILIYLVLGLIVWSILVARLNFTVTLMLALALYLLALAKLQTMLLPLGLVIVFLVVLARLGAFQWRAATGVALVCIVGAVLGGFAVQRYQQDRAGFMRSNHYVNLFNAYFGTVLPFMSAPAVGATILNLPEACHAYIGKTWYDTSRDTLPCRDELFGITLPQTVQLFTAEPLLLPGLVLKAIPHMRPWLHQLEGGIPTGLTGGSALAPYWSIGWLIDPLPIELYWATWIIFVAGSLLAAGIVLLPSALPSRLVQLAGIQLLMATVVAYSLLASLFGDGLFDFARHTYLARLPLLLGLGLVVACVAMLARFWMSIQNKPALADPNSA